MSSVDRFVIGVESTDVAGQIHTVGIKPRLRGVPDVFATMLAVPAAALLIAHAADGVARTASVIYGVALVLLFAVSATYHTPTWPIRVRNILRQLDHSTIYVLIAASYTPPCLLALPRHEGLALLTVVWITAAAGFIKSAVWRKAPRWLNAGVYVLMGWAVSPFVVELYHGLGFLGALLLLGGGVIYTVGAVIYSRRWPNPYPTVFGYHELFHVFVVAAAATQYVAMWNLVG
ncbi:MAG: hemolysin III family protein [Deltaproteobacteria bacterium]|nr:hemolysin III family protein [Deltaproteobacteria bacterium]